MAYLKMRDGGTTKAKQQRKKLDFARKYSLLTRSSTYNIVREWEEFNVGTPDYEVQITLVPGYSFEQDEHDNKRCFPSTNSAMIGVRNASTCSCPLCIKPGR